MLSLSQNTNSLILFNTNYSMKWSGYVENFKYPDIFRVKDFPKPA